MGELKPEGTETGKLSQLERMLNRMYRKQEALIVVAGVLGVLLIAIIDFNSGYQIGFSILYLVPIFIATLYVRKQAGIIIALAAAFAWVLSDLITDHANTQPVLAEWNVVIRVGFFALIAFSLISLKRSLEEERRLSRLDSLTGIGNVRAFNDYLQRRHTAPLSLAYIDVDNFKAVNDAQGHAQGDLLLQLIARLISANIRSTDLVARLGGDEFVVVFREVEPELIEAAVELLNQKLRDGVFAAGFPITFSIGVVTYTEPGTAVHHMIREADALMYTVKKSTKNDIAYAAGGDRRANGGN